MDLDLSSSSGKSTSSELSLAEIVDNIPEEEPEGSAGSPLQENSVVVSPQENENPVNLDNSEQSPHIASADSDPVLLDATNYEDEMTLACVDDSHIFCATGQPSMNSSDLLNDVSSDAIDCQGQLSEEVPVSGVLLSPPLVEENPRFTASDAYLTDDHRDVPSSSPIHHENGDHVPTSSPERNENGDDSSGMPSSSPPPPASSPVALNYFRSSSPIPSSSPPRASSLTPPTSPAKHLGLDMDLGNTNLDDSVIFADNDTTRKEAIGGSDELATDIVVAEIPPEGSEPKTTKQAPHGKKIQQNVIPGPKRSTLAAQQVQHRKLSKPFRSPMVTQAQLKEAPKMDIAISAVSNTLDKGDTRMLLAPAHDKIKHGTAKAAAQFKSPLSRELEVGPLVRPTPTIQALERKLQVLKRAMKVRENSEEEILTGLIKKWTEAGQEVAWEVWNLVKDNEQQETRNKRGYEDSWGWQDGGEAKRPKVEEERHWGWDIVPVAERERRSVGSMLFELGIGAETLGWNEKEGGFVTRIVE